MWATGSAAEEIVIGGLHGLDPQREQEPYPVLLALSGGGARGLAAVGVLKAFEERQIRVQAIAGTSMGGIIGGLYACGYSADDLDRLVRDLDFGELLGNSPARRSMLLTQRQENERHLLSLRLRDFRPQLPQGLTAGQRLSALLTSLTTKADYLAGGDFARLPIPFKTVTTDVASGRPVIIDHGSLADAMRATMAFPLAFTGVEQGDRLLMDGGMLKPIPVDVVREMGHPGDIAVAVNTTSPLVDKSRLNTALDIASQVTSIMTYDKLEAELALADIGITIDCPEVTLMAFEHVDTLIQLGYTSGLAVCDSIISLWRDRNERRDLVISAVDIVPRHDALERDLAEHLLNTTLSRRELELELKESCRRHNLFELTATVNTVRGDDSGSREVALQITAVRNPAGSGLRMRFEGNTIFDDSALAARFDFSDEAVTTEAVKDGLDSVIAMYTASGYDLAEIRSVDIDDTAGLITVSLDEAMIKRIDVSHNERTRDWLVRSYFPLHVGEPYSTEKATRGIANIYGTELFERVTLGIHPNDGGAVIDLGVYEKIYTQVRLGWHWHEQYGSEEFVELLDDNAHGIGMEYLMHGRLGPDRRGIYGSVSVDRLFFTYLTARLRLFHEQIDRRIYGVDGGEIGQRDEKTTGGLVTFGQQIARLGTVSTSLRAERVKYRDSRFDEDVRFDLRSVLFESQLENFDRVPFPHAGHKHVLRVQFAGKYLGGDIEYTKFFSSIESYLPLGNTVNYHPRLALGLSRRGLPPSEQFYLGGTHSLIGYRTHELGGDKMFQFNQELRLKLPLRLYLTAIYDIGEVYVSGDQIKLRNLQHGVGGSLALDTPIGPFEIGYGYVDRDHDRWYFNAGFDF